MIDSAHKEISNEDEIDLIRLFNGIWIGRFKILLATLLISVCSIIYALSLPNLYTTSSLLYAVQKSGQSESSSRGSIGNILSLAGGAAAGGGERAQLAYAIIKSREFFYHLTTIDDTLSKLVTANNYDPVTRVFDYDKNLFDAEGNEWKLSLTEAYDEFYRKSLKVSLNQKTGFITLSFDHISPEFSFEFIQLVINELNSLARGKDIKEATDAIEFLKEDLENYSQIGIQAAVGQLIESQLKTKMLANVRMNYLLEPIDRPILPDMKAKPYRAKIVAIYTLAGFVISLMLVVVINYLRSDKSHQTT
ncbi:Wzz/FepE/Etk N-terminal domain-containing protein [Gammaproteobacteria bacterium]|nr:Wzz/FepE/Etk N-terminal domain-containing protein [Gammaproteobacteria bacterium]